MREQRIPTILGHVSATLDGKAMDQPVVFMHGVFLDKSLWSAYGSDFTGRTHIYIDMPAHGVSSSVGRDWNPDECVTMLMEVLDSTFMATPLVPLIDRTHLQSGTSMPSGAEGVHIIR
jgi:pimeloyl-ACP methyl ester carboxylesterase